MLKGEFIGTKERKNTFVLKKTIFLDEEIIDAVIKVTALGLYALSINGKRVGDAYMTPGWTSYNKMLQVQEYPVKEYLAKGQNEIAITVNDGWYCGRFGLKSKNYGEQNAVCAELIIECLNGRSISLSTDESWRAEESYIRFSNIYDGEAQDYTAKIETLNTQRIDYNKDLLIGQICEPVRNTQSLSAIKLIRTPKGERVYDFGQNLTGVLEIKCEKSCALTVKYAEVLDKTGNFYTANLRSAKATDTFIVDEPKTVCVEFTFHGFRYAKIEGADIPIENVTAIVRHSDLRRTGYVSTSNQRVQRLIDNVVWGQRDNYLDVPTDCPQRDERLGWTGDANVFCNTASFNYDVRLFFKKWLADLRNDQAPTGEVPHVVPDVFGDKFTDAIWCDAVVMIPWKLYVTYDDKSFLEDNYVAMQKYLCAYEQTVENGLVVKGHQFGDWLALDIEQFFDDDRGGSSDSYFIANVFYSVTLKIVSKVAAILGDKEKSKYYKQKYNALIKNIRKEYVTANGRLVCETVTAQSLALYYDIMPKRFKQRLAYMLNQNVMKHYYRIVTGFIGTNYVLFALADNGYIDSACKVLMNSEYPGWLYEVDMGATTIWERWNSLLPDGSPSPATRMNSFNHYAYGSVLEFIYSRVAGIQIGKPGYKTVKIAPYPTDGLKDIRAEIDSVNGKIVAGYRIKDKTFTLFVSVPEGIVAEIFLPNEEKPVAMGCGEFSFDVELP